MRFTPLYTYAPLERVTHDDGTRFYTCPVTQRALPSVTTILAKTADRRALDAWIERIGEKKAEQERKEAGTLGSLMHEHLECHIQGLPRPRGNNLVRQMATKMADAIIREGLSLVDDVFGYEVPLYYPGVYAGTSDLVANYCGKPAIVDYKTSKAIKRRDAIGDYFAQLCAYALSHDRLYGTQIRTGVIFMVSRDYRFEKFVIEGDDFEAHCTAWARRADAFCRTIDSA